MGLSKDLINQFVEATRADKPVNTETTVYGKTVEYNGKMYVQLDGSDLLTPVNTTTSLKSDERVSVMIKNHTATVTGNLSSPSATSSDIKEVSDQISEFEIILADKVSTAQLAAERGRIDDLVSDNAVIKETLTATNADIINLQADNVVVKETLEANEAQFVKIEADIAAIDAVSTKDLDAINADIHNLEATYGEIEQLTAGNVESIRVLTDELAATDAAVENLAANQITTAELEAKYANIDFANIGMAAVEKLFTEAGIIKDLVVGDTSITGELVGVTIKGDIIEGNTVVADKLVVLGEDGLYYKLNTDGVSTTAEQTEYNSLNGSIITANTITAEKINVDDLVAFDATIGGFKIGTNSIYSGAKSSVDNTTRGTYLDKDGQVNFGDSNQYLKYYKKADGSYVLDICAANVYIGSKSISVETAINNVQSDIDNLEIGGRNLIQKKYVVQHAGTITLDNFISSGEVIQSDAVVHAGFRFDSASYYEPNTEYTLSGYVSLVSGVIKNFYIFNRKNHIFKSFFIDEVSYGTPFNTKITSANDILNDGLPHYFELHFTTASSIPDDSGTNYTYIQINKEVTTAVEYKIAGFKLEKGNKATDWTPAPEDIDASIDDVADTAQSAQDTATDAQTRVSITEASIRKLEDSISMLVRDENGASLMTQTSNGWTFNISSVMDIMNENSELISDLSAAVTSANGDITELQGVVDKLNTTSDYVRVVTYNSQPCIELGEADNLFRIRITNTAIEFVNGSTIMASMSNDKLYINKAEVLTEIRFGSFVWACRANGNFGLMWRGDE